MSTEKLTVRNFGPIKEVEIDLKKVTIFIGEQAGGKSTLAKLVAIFRHGDLLNGSITAFKELLKDYSLENFHRKNTYLEYCNDDLKFAYQFNGDTYENRSKLLNQKLKRIFENYRSVRTELENVNNDLLKYYKSNNNEDSEKFQELLDQELSLKIRESQLYRDLSSLMPTPVYYPAERQLISIISNTVFNFAKNNIPITRSLAYFGGLWEMSISLLNTHNFAELDLDYRLINSEVKVKYNTEDYVRISESSSGLQTLLPLLLVTEYFYFLDERLKKKQTRKRLDGHSFIIEEPELNLYPTTQKSLVEYLISKCTINKNNLIITTHSPYILSTFDNCIQAGNVVKARPEIKEKVETILLSKYHLDYEDVAVYYVADGKVKLIMDEEYKGIDTNAIDDVSEDLGSVFDELLALQYEK